MESKKHGLFEAIMCSTVKVESRSLVVKNSSSEQWNLGMGHASASKIQSTTPLVKGIPLNKCEQRGVCETCEGC